MKRIFEYQIDDDYNVAKLTKKRYLSLTLHKLFLTFGVATGKIFFIDKFGLYYKLI